MSVAEAPLDLENDGERELYVCIYANVRECGSGIGMIIRLNGDNNSNDAEYGLGRISAACAKLIDSRGRT